tara:strand:+ start:85 stop:447 length:363 start_codon:yes stop_codon:yes gene_type:complete
MKRLLLTVLPLLLIIGCSETGRKGEIKEKIESKYTNLDTRSLEILSMKESYKVDCYETYVVSYTFGRGLKLHCLVIYTNGKYCDIMDWDSDDTQYVNIIIDELRKNPNDPESFYQCYCNE